MDSVLSARRRHSFGVRLLEKFISLYFDFLVFDCHSQEVPVSESDDIVHVADLELIPLTKRAFPPKKANKTVMPSHSRLGCWRCDVEGSHGWHTSALAIELTAFALLDLPVVSTHLCGNS